MKGADGWWKGNFRRNVGVLVAGAGAAQLLTLLSMPLLLRLYSPADFGAFGVFLALSSLLTVVAAGRYDQAIPQPESHREGFQMVGLTITLAAVSSILILVAALILAATENLWVERTLGQRGLILLAPGVFLNVTYQAAILWSNRGGNYRRTAGAQIVMATVQVGLATAFYFIGLARVGFAAAYTGALLVVNLFMFAHIVREKAADFRLWRWGEFKTLARTHSRLPVFLTGTSFLSVATQQLPQLVLPAIFGLSEAGYYFLADRMVSVPSRLISAKIGDVFRQEGVRRLHRDGQFRRLYLKVGITSAALSLPLYAVLILASPYLFSLLFGEEWRVAGVLASLIGFRAWLQFAHTPLDQTNLIRGAYRFIFAWNLALFIGTAAVFLFGVAQGNSLSLLEITLLLVVVRMAFYIANMGHAYSLSCGRGFI